MNDAHSYKHIIETWMDSVTSDGGVDRFDDLHIDQISPSFSNRSEWVRGGVEMFIVAKTCLEKYGDTVTLALAFSLEASVTPKGPSAISSVNFSDQIDWSPPSLYLFWRNREPWAEKVSKIPNFTTQIDPEAVFGEYIHVMKSEYCCYLMEFKQEGNDEYYRTVFLTHT